MNLLPSQKTCAETLKINVEATPTEVMAAFLKHVSDEDMVPDFGAVVAVNRLANKTLPQNETDLYFLHGQFNKDLAEFKDNFWTLEPPERKQHWELLAATYPQPWAIRELARLKPGLDATPKSLANDEENAIVEVCKELFLSTPRQQIARRRKWYYEEVAAKVKNNTVRFSSSKRERLKIITRKVATKCPEIFSVVPELFMMVSGEPLLKKMETEIPLVKLRQPKWMDSNRNNARGAKSQVADSELKSLKAKSLSLISKIRQSAFGRKKTDIKSKSRILPAIFFSGIGVVIIGLAIITDKSPRAYFTTVILLVSLMP